MSDHALERTEINAPPARCYEVARDIERYPDWAPQLKEATVVERDAEGRPSLVAFRAAMMGHSTSYTIRYDYTEAPRRLAWKLVESDVARKLDGYYDFAPIPGSPERTDVTYELEAELRLPLPGFVKRRAEVRIIHTALRDLKARVEDVMSAGGGTT